MGWKRLGLGYGEDLHSRIAVPSAEIYMLCGCWHDMRLSFVLDFVCQTPFRDVVVRVIFMLWDRFGV